MRKTIITCDFCGKEIDTGKVGINWHTITWHGLLTEMSKDVCGECWEERLFENDKPPCEVRTDFIYDKLAELFDAPCNWSFDGMGDMDDFMYEKCGDWCERHCKKDEWATCWRKLMEVMANEQSTLS